MPYQYASQREDLLKRLRRIEGQVRGIARMVEEDQYCVDVLNQIAAVNAALDKVGMSLLSDHIRGCVTDAVSSGGGEEKVDELVGVVGRFLKT
ncbi:MAG TPA: metal-sensitive transcriptional regulator [Actinomycetota bacterium]